MDQIFNGELIRETIGGGGTVLILAGIGYMFTDRAGVFNIAIEGLMLFAAFFAVVGAGTLHNSAAGVLCGVSAALIVSLIFFVVSIRMRADIIVVGIAVNLLAGAFTIFMLNHLYGVQGNYMPTDLQTVPGVGVPVLSALPLIGPVFSDQSLLTYAAWLVVPLSWLVLYRTPFGLRLRSVGENPEAAATVGINVQRVQLASIVLCGVLAGLAGCYFSIGPLGGFNQNMTAGKGWIALAAETLGNGTPLGTFLACLLFAGAEGVSNNMQAAGIGASQFADAIPYTLTVIGLAVAARRALIRRVGRRRGVGPRAPEGPTEVPSAAPTTGG